MQESNIAYPWYFLTKLYDAQLVKGTYNLN